MQTKISTINIKLAVTKLPLPVPGRVIDIPISLWPEYQRLHNLEVVGKKNGAILVLPLREKTQESKKEESC
jgi:hypothetical protein